MSAKIVVVGDFLAALSLHTPRFPRPYQRVEGHGFYQVGEGHGTLQAVAAARLGASVTFVGRVGTDVNAGVAAALFEAEGVSAAYMVRDAQHHTGVRLTFAESASKTMGAESAGANAHLSEQDVKAAEPAILAADVLLAQFAVPLDTVRRALQLAQKHGVRSVIKPTPYRPVSDEVLVLADVLTPNESELREMATQQKQSDIATRQTAVCTLGASGAQWFRKEGGQMHTGRVGGFAVRAVDTTGAGDVFSAALAVALAESQPLEDAIRFANAAAALSTMQNGTLNSAPTREQVEALVAKRVSSLESRQSELSE